MLTDAGFSFFICKTQIGHTSVIGLQKQTQKIHLIAWLSFPAVVDNHRQKALVALFAISIRMCCVFGAVAAVL